jgi:Icc-related predicted phosphoesterase
VSAVKKLVKARYNDRKKFNGLIISGDLPATVPFTLITHYILRWKNFSRIGYSKQVYFEKLRQKFVIAQIKSLNQIIPLLQKLEIPLYYIPGNIETRDSLDYLEKNFLNIHFLEKKQLTVENNNHKLTIVGLGGSLDHLGVVCDNEYTEIEFNNRVKELNSQLNKDENSYVFVFHEPPKFTRDLKEHQKMVKKSKKRGFFYNFPREAGSLALYDLIIKYNPKLVINGHFHEYSGKKMIKNIPVVNPGALASYQYAIVEINSKVRTKFYRIRSSPFSFINFLYQSRLYHQGTIRTHS